MLRYQTQLWKITFGFSLILLFWTCSTAQNVNSTDPTRVTPPDVLSERNDIKGLDTHTLPSHNSDEQNKTVTSSSDINEVPGNAISISDPHVNVTADNGQITTQLTNTTTNDDHNEGSPPKFNYAIIAAIGVLVLFTVLCLKCCTWFRAYTRGGDKDETTTQYAAILHTGDEEYGHIDLQSDTTSTVYFDTISSYQSFLKRHGTDSSGPSSRSPKSGFSRQNSSSPRKENGRQVFKDLDVKYTEMRQARAGSRAETPDTCSPRSESAMSDNVRTFSVSSEDTDPSSQPRSLSNDEEINTKKAPRSKVSFTTDTSTTTSNNRIERQRSFNRAILMSVPREHHNRSMSCRNSHRLSDLNDNAFRLKPITPAAQSGIPGTGIDVATQTNRSFTFSRWKSRKRHYSDSGVDDMVGPPTIHELASSSNYTDNCGHTAVPIDMPINNEFPLTLSDSQNIPSLMPNKTAILQMNPQTPMQESTGDSGEQSIAHVLNQEFTGKRLNCETSISESESNDDVFVTDGSVTAGIKHIRDNNNSCTCVVNGSGEYCGCTRDNCDNKPTLNVSRSPKPFQTPDVNLEHDGMCPVVYGQCITESNKSNKDKDNGMEAHITNCKDCLQRHKLIPEQKPRCKSGTSCDMFLINELDGSDNDKCDVYDQPDSPEDDTYSTVLKHLNNGDVLKLNGGVGLLNNVDDNSYTSGVGPDVTSSMTSSESSGYAEMSSEALTA